MFCHNCGAEIKENAKFCTKCGAALLQDEPKAVLSEQTVPHQENVRSIPQVEYSSKKQRQSVNKPIFKKWWFWLLAVIVVSLLIPRGGSSKSQDSGASNSSAPAATVETNQQTKASAPTPTPKPTPKPTPTPTPTPNIWLKGGTYKVGTDIQAGEYVIEASGFSCYIELDKDSSGTFDSIIANENTSAHVYFTVKDGEYLKVQGGKLAWAEDVEPYEPKDGIYEEGMYKVGKDIPPGEYKIVADSFNCYFEVDNNSRNTFDSIVSNDNIAEGESTYISVREGQYLKVWGGKIVVS